MANLRRTGRTTRMLLNAISCAMDGKAVYVIAANTEERARLIGLILLMTKDENCLGIRIETPDSLINFNWETFVLRGAWLNCKVFVDHYTIEQKFGLLLQKLHQYD